VDSIDTIGDAIAAARPAYDALTTLAEDVEDEWSYINDLSSVWIERLDAVDHARGHEPAPAGAADAVPALIAEVATLDDPHRAIDWLSTFPQVLLIAIGERP
jgi:hypothetical protein